MPSPRHDAEELAAPLARRRSGATCGGTTEPGPAFTAYVDRRAAREPLQHITGVAYFRHLALQVGPGVFVPRPETEVVVDAVLSALSGLAPAAGVVDLCTGAGRDRARRRRRGAGEPVHAVELDPEAHGWAARNCAGSDGRPAAG